MATEFPVEDRIRAIESRLKDPLDARVRDLEIAVKSQAETLEWLRAELQKRKSRRTASPDPFTPEQYLGFLWWMYQLGVSRGLRTSEWRQRLNRETPYYTGSVTELSMVLRHLRNRGLLHYQDKAYRFSLLPLHVVEETLGKPLEKPEKFPIPPPAPCAAS